MKSSLYERAKMFLQAHRKKNIWYRLVSVLAVVVVFVTTYMLVLPAITMEHATYCGIEEHLHTAECYSRQYIFTCGQDESSGHEHTDDCLEAVSVLTCTKEEHYHTDECYAQPEQIEDGGAAEILADGGDGELIIDNTPEQEEFPELSFKDDPSVIDPNGAKNTASENETESETETEEETTEAAVYYCGREAHIHTDECFNEENEVICGKMTHQHTEECLKVPETEEETTEAETEAETEEAATEAVVEAEEETTEAAAIETEEATTEAAEPETEEATTEAAETETETTTPSAEPETESETETEEATTEAVQQPQMNSWGWGGAEGPGFEDNGVFVSGNRQNTTETDTETEDETESETESGSEIETETESESESETEPQYICGLEEHTHTEACYDEEGNLVCDLEEHTHTEECLGDTLTSVMSEIGDEPLGDEPSGDEGTPGDTSTAKDLLAKQNTKVSGSGTKYDPSTGDFETHLHFDYELGREEIQSDGYEYYIVIPEGVIVPEGLFTQGLQPFYDENNHSVQAGTYEFVKDGTTNKILLHFSKAYVDSAGTTVKGFAEFGGFLRHDKFTHEGDIKVEFSDGKELNIPSEDIKFDDDETYNHDIDVSKDGSYEIKGDKLVYTVKIRSFKGTPDPIDFKDTLIAGDLPVKDLLSVEVQEGTFNYYNGYYAPHNDDHTAVKVTYKYDSSTKELSMQLPGLKPGESIKDSNGADAFCAHEYVITYEYSLDKLPDGKTYKVNNEAYVEATNKTTGEVVKDSSSSTIDITTEMTFSKSGYYNKQNNRIEWKLEVNKNKIDIAGAKIEDDMLEKATDIIVNPDEGWRLSEDKQYIEFLEIGESGVNTNSYTITYYTKVESSWDGKVENTATFDHDGIPGNGDEKVGSCEVNTSGGGVEKKFVEAGKVTADNTVEVTWRTKITVPQTGLPANIVLQDDMLHDQYGNAGRKQYMTQAQINEWLNGILNGSSTSTDALNWPAGGKYTITFTDENGNNYTSDQAIAEGCANTHFVGFSIKIEEFPEGATGDFWFTYKTTADISDAQRGLNYYNNAVDFGGKKHHDSYQFREGGVTKTDGNNQTGTTSVENEGTLTWKVTASLDERAPYYKLTVEDQLPEHILLEKIDVNGTELTIAEDGTISGTVNEFAVNGKYDSATGKVKVDISKTDGTALPNDRDYYLTYTCNVDKENLATLEDGQKYLFTNNVTVFKDGTEFGNAQQTQEWTETVHVEEEKKIEKLGNWDNNNRQIDYTVEINPKGEDLVPGSDVLTLTDTLTYNYGHNQWGAAFDRNVSLIQSSVHLYEAVQDESGNLVQGTLVTDWEWVYKEEAYENQTWGKNFKNIITAEIPDGKAFILKYSYRVQMNKAGEGWNSPQEAGLTVRNTVKIEGTTYEDDADNYETKWGDQESSVGVVTDKNYTFYKVEKGNYGIGLQNTTFSIYEVSADGTKETFVENSTTDTTGKFQIVWKKDESKFKKNTLYYVVEKAAADGYILPENPPKYYFYFSDASASETLLPEENIPANAVDLSATSHATYIENEKNSTEIEVDKKWFNPESSNDVTDQTKGQITFDLMQRASTTPPSGTSTGGGDSGESAGGSSEILINWNDYTSPKYHTGFKANPGDKIKVTVRRRPDLSETVEYIVFIDSNWKGTTRTFLDNKLDYEITLEDNAEICVMDATRSWHSLAPYNNNGITFSFSIVKDEEPDPGDSGEGSGEDPDTDAPTYVDKKYGTYTITDAMGWKWSSESAGLELPKVGQNEDGERVYYTYYVVEHNAEYYQASYSDNNADGGIASGTIVITNTPPPTPETVSVKVEKHWLNDNGFEISPDISIIVQLYCKNVDGTSTPVGEPVTLSKENDKWMYEWTGLQPGIYYVEETIPDEYAASYTAYYTTDGMSYTESDGTPTGSQIASDVTVSGGATGTTIYINNWYTPHTKVTVKKVWLDRDGSKLTENLPESIEVQLYQSDDKGANWTEVADGKATLNAENGWSHTWDNLDGDEYDYYVEETQPEGEWKVTYQVEKEGAPTGSPEGESTASTLTENPEDAYTDTDSTITITNQKNDTDISVKKNWVGYDGNPKTELTGLTITVDLWKKGESEGSEDTLQEGKTITLPGEPSASDITVNGTYSDDGWGFTWKDLPQGTYYVKETAVSLDGTDVKEKYDVTYSAEGSDGQPTTGTTITDGTTTYFGVESGTLVITNTEKHTSVSVEKVWQGPDNKPAAWTPPADGIEVQLYQKQADGSYVEYLPDDVGKQTLKAETGWKFTWENLPEGEYYVEETTKLTSYTVTYKSTDNPNPSAEQAGTAANFVVKSGTITITNTEEWKELEVYKKWQNTTPSSDTSIEVKLCKSTEKPNDSTNPSSLATVNLPTGTEPVTLARANASAADGPGTAESTTSITLRVGYWLNGSNEHVQRPAAGWVKMQIWQCTADGQMLGSTPVATGTLSYENEWSVTARGLPGQVVMDGSLQPVSYFVKFEAGGAGNSIERVVLMNNLDSGCIVSGAVPSSELMLSAIIGEGTGMAAMSSYKTKSANQTINLPQGSQPIEGLATEQNTTSVSDPSKFATTVTLNASNSWFHKWEHLPKYNDKGEELYYSVQEVTNLDGFKTTYDYSNYDKDNSITIINEKVVDVSVKKNWENFKAGSYDDLVIHVQLMGDGVAQHDAQLDIYNNWSCKWEDLPANQTYTVTEIEVYRMVDEKKELFSEYQKDIKTPVQITPGENYEITITNTYNPNTYTLPETGGPGTLPYTVGGTLLTAFAALLLYIQNKRRKEGQGTS